jgi:hypothetical protein
MGKAHEKSTTAIKYPRPRIQLFLMAQPPSGGNEQGEENEKRTDLIRKGFQLFYRKLCVGKERRGMGEIRNAIPAPFLDWKREVVSERRSGFTDEG